MAVFIAADECAPRGEGGGNLGTASGLDSLPDPKVTVLVLECLHVYLDSSFECIYSNIILLVLSFAFGFPLFLFVLLVCSYSTGNRGKDVLDGEEQTKTI